MILEQIQAKPTIDLFWIGGRQGSLRNRPDIIECFCMRRDSQASLYLYRYCSEIEDDERVWQGLADAVDKDAPGYQYTYCRYFKNRPIMKEALFHWSHASKWQNLYRSDQKAGLLRSRRKKG